MISFLNMVGVLDAALTQTVTFQSGPALLVLLDIFFCVVGIWVQVLSSCNVNEGVCGSFWGSPPKRVCLFRSSTAPQRRSLHQY